MNLGELLRGGKGTTKEIRVNNKNREVKTITDPLLLKWMNNIRDIRNENKGEL